MHPERSIFNRVALAGHTNKVDNRSVDSMHPTKATPHMITVTEIRKAKRRSGLHEVHTSDGDVVLLHEESVVRGAVHSGRVFSETEWVEFTGRDQELQCRRSAWEQISRSQTNSVNLKKTLQKKNFTVDVIKRVVDHLIFEGHLDDRAWAEQFVRERLSRGEGIRLIESRLIRRGFDREFTREVMASTKPDEATERRLALQQLEKWNRRSKPVEKTQRARAAGAWLIRRGFSNTVAWDVVREFFSVEED